ncbi:oxidoreductase-like protein [Diaporthe sp. PMI_573]|nr:oxidoreductase-like protein [Diaporthaceae sp. PMI_573]
MSSSVRTMLFNPRPLRSLVATSRASRAYATIPTKNPTPSPPKEDSNEQAMPIGRFYEAILNSGQPIPDVKPEEPASSVKAAQEEDSPKEPAKRTSPPVPTPPPTQESAQDKAKVIFGSRLAGPAERAEQLAKLRQKSTLVAGVLVPPKPEEPDNCCMSGCVNCVWDRYRDEMEDWALADAEAKSKLAAERAAEAGTGAGANHTAASMDDGGGGSDTNWDVPSAPPSPKIAKDFWDDDLYKNVPVGIREFMKQEKRLKEKHAREGTSGG